MENPAVPEHTGVAGSATAPPQDAPPQALSKSLAPTWVTEGRWLSLALHVPGPRAWGRWLPRNSYSHCFGILSASLSSAMTW